MPTHGERGALDDDKVVRASTERLAEKTAKPIELVEAAVRGELIRRRESARIQTFVPILAERAARNRLAS
jgi:hypothetical protein